MKIIEELKNIKIDSENLIQAIVSLFTLAHDNGLSQQAIQILADCGIKFEVGYEK